MQRVGLNLKNVINLTVVVDANYSRELLFGSTNYYFKWNEMKNITNLLLRFECYANENIYILKPNGWELYSVLKQDMVICC